MKYLKKLRLSFLIVTENCTPMYVLRIFYLTITSRTWRRTDCPRLTSLPCNQSSHDNGQEKPSRCRWYGQGNTSLLFIYSAVSLHRATSCCWQEWPLEW